MPVLHVFFVRTLVFFYGYMTAISSDQAESEKKDMSLFPPHCFRIATDQPPLLSHCVGTFQAVNTNTHLLLEQVGIGL